MARRSPQIVWCAALTWCALAGWFAFVQGRRVPVLWFADFGFHELGHMICYPLPVGEVITAAMGSVSQCAVPLGFAAYFWFSRRDAAAAAACTAWSATNFRDVSVYIADAPYERLPLIGGKHDWATILGPEHFNRLQDAHAIATVTRTIGLVVLGAATLIAFRGLLFSGSGSATADPVAATASRSDDRFPST